MLSSCCATFLENSWLFKHRLHCVKLTKKIGDQAKDIVRDPRPVHELRNEESAADLGEEHVSFAKFVPAGDYFNRCEHDPSLMQLRLLITYVVAHEEGKVNLTCATYQPALIVQHDRFARAQRQARAPRDDGL